VALNFRRIAVLVRPSSNNRGRRPWTACDQAPRAREDSMRPRRLVGAPGRPLNFRVADCHRRRRAIPCAPRIAGVYVEVSRATQERTPGRRLLSRSPVSDVRGSHQRRALNAEPALFAATRSSPKSSAAMTRAPASQAVDFKSCCMLSGEFDGSDRDHFFQRVITTYNNRWRGP
jgi:hypothetical protein